MSRFPYFTLIPVSMPSPDLIMIRKLLFTSISILIMAVSSNAQADAFQYIVLVDPAASAAAISDVRAELNSDLVAGMGCSEFNIEVWEVRSFPYQDPGNNRIITDIDGTIGNASGKTEIDGVGLNYLTDIIRGLPEVNTCMSYNNLLPQRGCDAVTVAFCDTGIGQYSGLGSINSPLPISNYDGYDFVNDDPDPSDDHGHGTHISSAAILTMNYTPACVGDNYKYLFYKTQAADGTGNIADLISGICEAYNNDADIINLSLSYPDLVYKTEFDALSYVIDRVTESGVAVITAAGNDSYDNDQPVAYLPASYPHDQISVGSADCNGDLSSFSNFGDRVHVAFRGEGIRAYNIDYSSMISQSGTSQATAITSAVAALILSNVDVSPQKLKCALVATSTPTQGLDGVVLADGLLDPISALQYLANGETCSLPCISNLQLGNNALPSDAYRAEETIISQNLIQNDMNIGFKAGQSVSLGESFEVEQGATFDASIAPCQ